MDFTFKKQGQLENIHESCKTQSFLSRNTWQGQDLGQALFYSIKKKDWKHAFYLLEQGAPICKNYEFQKNVFYSTTGLLIKRMCESRVAKGHQVLDYKVPDRLLDIFIKLNTDLRCRCTQKFPHKCPLYVSLSELSIKSEEEIYLPKNILVRKLIQHGATLKKNSNDPKTYQIPWFDVDQIKSYLNTQGLQKLETQQQVKQKFNNNSTFV